MFKKNVSVIIPSYNRAHILGKTIPSYIQDVTQELIIVDDGSTDHTKEKVFELKRKYSEIKYIALKKHRGLPYANNIGVSHAKGKYIFFGDDDACLYQGTLYRLRDALENFPADIAGANGSYATDMWQIKNMKKYIEMQFVRPFDTKCIMNFNTGQGNFNYKIDRITEGLFVMACFMIRADLARDVKYDISYIGNASKEDMDYLLQHAEKGRRMVYVPEAYEIDIPRRYVKDGGCHSLNPIMNYWYNIRNNNYFMNKHYTFLKQEGYISVSKLEAKLCVCRNSLKGVLLLIKNII